MAKTSNQDYSVRSGKLNKKDPVIYRLSYGKQQVYTAEKSDVPASPAQKAHRKFFGKVTALVNAIMTDPKQAAEWQQRMDDYHHSIAQDIHARRFKTLRSFVHSVISAQLAQNKSVKRKRKGIKTTLPKGFKMHIKPFSELSTTELYELIKARFNVFYLEQKIVYPDLDDIDYLSIHLALHRKGKVIAYARLFKGKKVGEWHVGRMLTTERNQGFGKWIMEQTIQEAERQGAKTLVIHAQTHAVSFYEQFGFATTGNIFMEAGIPHVLMTKSLI